MAEQPPISFIINDDFILVDVSPTVNNEEISADTQLYLKILHNLYSAMALRVCSVCIECK